MGLLAVVCGILTMHDIGTHRPVPGENIFSLPVEQHMLSLSS